MSVGRCSGGRAAEASAAAYIPMPIPRPSPMPPKALRSPEAPAPNPSPRPPPPPPLFPPPPPPPLTVSHVSKASNWSTKYRVGTCWYSGLGVRSAGLSIAGSFAKTLSRTTSHVPHSRCECAASGIGGWLTGVQPTSRISRSAKKKLRKRFRTSWSFRKTG